MNLKEAYPDVVEKYWNYFKNVGIHPEDFSPKSSKKVWWKCPACGGEWETAIATKTSGKGCPFCAGQKILVGFNDLATKRPDLLGEWDYEKNGSLTPQQLTQFTNKKVWWKCPKGHSYLQTVSSKSTQNSGCPYCSGTKVLKGFNDFASQYPGLLKEWDYEKNEIMPEEVSQKSSKRVHWICRTCGRKWTAAISDRANGQGCKVCGNLRGMELRRSNILSSGGSLAEKRPELLSEWDYEKNTISPFNITVSSTSKKVYWLCDMGHSYLMTPASKTNQNQGCPYCAGKHVLKGFNDLETNYPEIAKLWDYNRNNLTPSEVMKGSSKKVWWICPDCGKPYLMPIHQRTKETNNYVCYACSKKRGAETKVKNMIADGNTLAVLEPELAKEWHPSKNGGLTPNDVTRASSQKVWWLCLKCGNEWQMRVHARAKGQGCPECAKAYQTSEPEQMIFYYVSKYLPDAINSYKNEQLGRQEIDIYIPSLHLGIEYDGRRWHKDTEKDKKKTEQLKKLGIDLVRFRENRCPELDDGSFQITADDNYKNYSALDKPIEELFVYINGKYGLNIKSDIDCYRDGAVIAEMMKDKIASMSFAAIRPDLIKEWHQTKNGYMTPYNTVATSNRKRIWWKCSVCGHEWQAVPASRYAREKGHGCPNCAKRLMSEAAHNRQFTQGVNDLATVRPDLLNEWDYKKNSKKPEEYAVKSNESVWWKCELGHSFKQRIAGRTTQHQGCPYCSGNKVLPGFNDLATVNPELVKDWDYEKNGELLPTMITSRNQRMIHWKCHLCGYEWKDKLEHRAYGRKCRRCKGTGIYQETLFDDEE